mgnify:CR=1 FL=1
MKKLIAIGLLLVAAALCFAADPAEGFWIEPGEKSPAVDFYGWKMWVQDDVLFATLVSEKGAKPDELAANSKKKSYADFCNGADISTLPVYGTPWIFNMKKKAEGRWVDGAAIDSDTGERYKCKVTFHKADGKKYKTDTLEIRYEVGPFGESSFLRPATEAEATNLW